MAIPVRQTKNEVKRGNNTTTAQISSLAGIVDGDVLILLLATDGNSTGHNFPSGFTIFDACGVNGVKGPSNRCTVTGAWKIASGESGSYPISWTGNEQAIAEMYRIDGARSGDEIDDPNESNSGTSSTAAISPVASTAVDDSLVFVVFAMDDDDITVDGGGDADYTVEDVDESNSGANTTSIGVQTKGIATAAVPPQCDLTLTASEEFAAFWFAIKGPVAGTTLNVGKAAYAFTTPGPNVNAAEDIIPATVGYDFTGQPVTVKIVTTLVVGKAAYDFTGKPVTLKKDRLLQVTKVGWDLTGKLVTVNAETVLTPATVVWDFTGQAVTTLISTTLTIGKAALTWATQALNINAKTDIIPAKVGYDFTAQAVTVKVGTVISVVKAAYDWTSQAVTLKKDRLLQPAKAAYDFTEGAVVVNAANDIKPAKVGYDFTGRPVTLKKDRLIIPAKVAFDYTGKAVTVSVAAGTTIQPGTAGLNWTGKNVTVLKAGVSPLFDATFSGVFNAIVNAVKLFARDRPDTSHRKK